MSAYTECLTCLGQGEDYDHSKDDGSGVFVTSTECPDCLGTGNALNLNVDPKPMLPDVHCHWCFEELNGKLIADMACQHCWGTGLIDQWDHPDCCNQCGMSGSCPDCSPKEDFR